MIARLLYWITFLPVTMVLHSSTRTRVVIRRGNEILLIKNRLSDGSWDLPGGGVKRGEALDFAAAREVHEELGIALSPTGLKTMNKATIHRGPFWFRAVYFQVNITKKPTLSLQSFEVVDAQWIKHRDLGKHRLSQGVKDAVHRCYKSS